MDLRVQHPAMHVQAIPVHDESSGGEPRRDHHDGERHQEAPGAEELAVALSEDGRAAMEAHYEEDAEGNPRIRIVDTERSETVAVVTPEELRALAERTGLPPGLLVRTAR